MIENENKHFEVVYGKILGIPIGSAKPVSPKGNKIFIGYFIPFAIGILVALNSNSVSIFMLGWCLSAATAYFFIRQLKHTASFERQNFFKPNSE